METGLHNVADLADSTRRTVEALIGHPLRNDQRIYIAALNAASEPTPEQRSEAWRNLESIADEMRAHARNSGLAVEEVEQIIDEACDEVRYGA